jgi:UDP-N-acetyl-2-amino-2-deoxyglucuronate dehydrogenase
MSGERLRIGVVGAGLGSAPHFKSLQALDDQVDVAWLHVRQPERLSPAALPPGVRLTGRYDDLLEDPRLQGLLILTPPNTHLELVQRAARAGKHVLLEKPLEISLAKAEALVAVCEQQQVKLAVMLQHRLRESSLALAALIASGELGELAGVSCSMRWWRPQSYYDEPGRGSLARDGGGVLITQAIHTLDLLISLTGLPAQVTALARTSALHQMECEDSVTAVLSFANGAIGSMEATTAAFPGFAERIALNFTGGSATLEAGEMQAWLMDGRQISAGARQATGTGANVMAFDHQPHQAVIADFLQAVGQGTTPAVSGRSALQVHRLIAALTASAQQGGPVML